MQVVGMEPMFSGRAVSTFSCHFSSPYGLYFLIMNKVCAHECWCAQKPEDGIRLYCTGLSSQPTEATVRSLAVHACKRSSQLDLLSVVLS